MVLANRPGGIGNSGDNFTGTVFDDEAGVALGAVETSAPYSGSFRPQVAVDQLLSRFDGESQNGTWTLKVSDLAGADTGTLQSWGLDVATVACDFVPSAAPGQPTGLAATAGSDSVALDWDDTPAATEYEIYRRGSGGAIRRTQPRRQRRAPSPTQAELRGRVLLQVGALNGASPGPLSEERCATVPLAALPPGPPGGPPVGPPPGDRSSTSRGCRDRSG